MRRLLLTLLVAVLGMAAAVESPILPDSGPKLPPAQEARARALGGELRCPVCRGLPIGESPAELARQMMGELRTQIAAGKNDSQIVDYFIARYGESVRLTPPKAGVGLIVWLAPILAVLLGGYGLWVFLRNSSRKPAPTVDPDLLARVRADLAAGSVAATQAPPPAPARAAPPRTGKGAKK